ncbi:helix-turn-helix transcriptional regulator [Cucumibacter marinus]|uniref:helix-turn-helix transcriptional regulator n=1 Tax=Cucumibacter marinus TaxID=1121252 RepID=UPI00040B4311|nr:YafY family protein [Cucumibacter marinus]
MRRADRLFEIVQLLRGGRLVTARMLAERLEVSERTIYRDIADLQASGVPVDGEAGIGYIMRQGYDLPPLMFNRAEIAALVVGARLAKAWAGASTARAAEEALVKIEAVLPENLRPRLAETAIFAPQFKLQPIARAHFDRLQAAAEGREVMRFAYRDEQGNATERDVRPLGLWFWGNAWTAVCWCELREDFRSFRLDRIELLEFADRHFKPEKGKMLADYYERLTCEQGIKAPFRDR